MGGRRGWGAEGGEGEWRGAGAWGEGRYTRRTMISAVTGEVREVTEDRVMLGVGPMVLELMVPASDIGGMQGRVGEEVVFHTMMYLEGDSSGGNSEPRLLGFLRREDKRFFEKFITVKGIGPRKALRALVLPAGEIAAAIEGRDARKLSTLPGVGKRTAEQVIAELSGKVQEFITAATGKAAGGGAKAAVFHGHTPEEDDAILSLLALGERRPDAEALLERAKQAEPRPTTTDALVRTMLRLRGGR